MKLRLVDENGAEVDQPYEIRLPGWTEERYFAEAPEEGTYELVDGELIVHSPVNIHHQQIVGFLSFLLEGVVSKGSSGQVLSGPAVLRLRENLCREPDIFFVSRRRRPRVTEEYVDGPADFVIEVLSESSRTRDLKEKASDYAAAGVGEYWAVDPARREVTVHRLKGRAFEVRTVKDGRVESTAVPGYWVQVEWLWERPLPNKLECLRRLLGQSP